MVATLPPRTEPEPPADGEAPRCLVHIDVEAVWTSPTGHAFCQQCKETVTELDLYPQEGLQPVDLRELMTGTPPEEEWMVEPMFPVGKLCGVVSKRGEGKSLLMLDIAAARAAGLPTLNQPAGEPTHVIYIDMEMGPDDLYERLSDLGYHSDHPNFDALATHLHYYQLVALPPLDTADGGAALEDLVERHGARLVIIDTVSRVVSGAENDAEPYRDLFRHTETMLKRRRVTLARLDHLGKDKEKGSRGSSAKEDPLDVVWHLTHTVTGAIELTLTKGRQVTLPRTVTIHKEERAGGTFAHVIHDPLAEQWLLDLVGDVDGLGLPPTASVKDTQEALKKAGKGRRRELVSQVVRFRKGRKPVGNRSGTPFGNRDGNHGNATQETLIDTEENNGNPIGNPSEPSGNVFPPPRVGNVPTNPEPDDVDLAEYDFDPADFEED